MRLEVLFFLCLFAGFAIGRVTALLQMVELERKRVHAMHQVGLRYGAMHSERAIANATHDYLQSIVPMGVEVHDIIVHVERGRFSVAAKLHWPWWRRSKP